MKGIFTALFTPFNEDYSINEKSLEKLVKFNLDFGVHGFYVGGSTSEAMLMEKEDRKKIFKLVKSACGDAVPMIAHVGSISTDVAVELALEAKKLGYNAISAVAPFYYGFPIEAIKNYYYEIISAADLPMYIYNFPAGNGFGLTADIVEDMFNHDSRFAGIKHTSTDLFALKQFKQRIENITIFNGYDEVCLAGLSMGADGAIGSTYNFMGSKFVNLYDAFLAGDINTAQRLQDEACMIITEMCKYGVFQCGKEILTQMGIDMGPCRKPFLPITQKAKLSVSKLLDLI